MFWNSNADQRSATSATMGGGLSFAAALAEGPYQIPRLRFLGVLVRTVLTIWKKTENWFGGLGVGGEVLP
jgi:hypothetical protein